VLQEAGRRVQWDVSCSFSRLSNAAFDLASTVSEGGSVCQWLVERRQSRSRNVRSDTHTSSALSARCPSHVGTSVPGGATRALTAHAPCGPRRARLTYPLPPEAAAVMHPLARLCTRKVHLRGRQVRAATTCVLRDMIVTPPLPPSQTSARHLRHSHRHRSGNRATRSRHGT
jgi:hypothetical protein